MADFLFGQHTDAVSAQASSPLDETSSLSSQSAGNDQSGARIKKDRFVDEKKSVLSESESYKIRSNSASYYEKRMCVVNLYFCNLSKLKNFSLRFHCESEEGADETIDHGFSRESAMQRRKPAAVNSSTKHWSIASDTFNCCAPPVRRRPAQRYL